MGSRPTAVSSAPCRIVVNTPTPKSLIGPSRRSLRRRQFDRNRDRSGHCRRGARPRSALAHCVRVARRSNSVAVMPLGLFLSRTFSGINVMTLLLYGAVTAPSSFYRLTSSRCMDIRLRFAGAVFPKWRQVDLSLPKIRSGRMVRRDHEKGRRSGRSRKKPFERKHHRIDETGWIKILFESAAQLAHDALLDQSRTESAPYR
jgi:hypothetical protein